MTKDNISIATITLARDDEEEMLLRKSLQQLAQLQMPVFVSDGGSRAGFIDFLKSFPNFILSKAEARGVWEQAKNSVVEASLSSADFIFYTEPDKFDFFSSSLDEMLQAIQTTENTGIVTASRSAAAFATFPAFQQMTETTINNCCAEVIGHHFDFTYGPFLLNKHLVPYLNLVQDDIGWGWRPYIFNIAKRLGFTVEAYEADLYCPEQQREDTAAERVYRMRQLSQNIEGIVLSTRVKLKDD
ncbi:hypothetical protein [Segetibacter aerophilus]|uniref:Glycosyltransferase 2-like domain-containing protein n=1 Tax=Segetibacter aerophilus TaxID=670293 RepID=A0A512BCT1_9BACT|nr:hypothetical protein [Segetibacter aerophilus]GEO09761.1 hypothetical protein SAE01_22570 [Segetibacter aerophilus]